MWAAPGGSGARGVIPAAGLPRQTIRKDSMHRREPCQRPAASCGGHDMPVGNAGTLELGERFATVVASEVIEHLANPGLFLERVKAHLKPGGRIVLSTPVPFGLLHLLYAWRNWPKTCSNPEHTLWLCPSTLGELAGRVGLRVVECRLVDDYQSATGSRGYRMFVWLMRTLGRMLPRRLRCNCMVAVLEVEEDAGGEGIARWAR